MKHKNWKEQRHTEAKQRKALKRRREMNRRAAGKLTPPQAKRMRARDVYIAARGSAVTTLASLVFLNDRRVA